MKKISMMICVTLVAMVLGFGTSSATTEEDTIIKEVTNTVARIQYTKDPRTGLCFAIYQTWVGFAKIASLSTVPCEAIPSNLLITVKLP
ncbi:TPA: hypothetical protein DCZ46_02930 [Candidatus Campbellbacteria bacterium]|uniref:Uncharacterized protein n=2 Tax=Candidatus Campbelliibacteriota TaxID=1752727 RepID=A0A1F5EPF4_9BACT|nr:MAG: hypothetical protein UR74_C0002G0185 [Candidatus Campbellbacteria bacterium GW2011_GWD2_35_24]KKP75805.1 MAG: hypothetical protein UR75_C0002G0186 [Candidatus Campbellbacteria bacterium GW2011_GWC2_35_28]KKP76947.1 MAG: hypothetical protein UR76_C0002G0148 [Candidatus Campbellbacteria bacterium GW2011_GWC1_35_31]KKP78873.1 MAG: hypothetical protein UR79_C0002G0148 [Candidatus Campbellbacteria bacterium GW2011_GWD1_35_49]OGD68861.1 MAG: hypothetical protein A2811_00075 [Candidatus Campbe